LSDKIKPWERQKNESSPAYEAFSLYQNMGAERSYAKVVEKLRKSETLINRWGSQWNWIERTRAWDNELTKVTELTSKKAVAKMVEKHINIAGMLQTKAYEALKNINIESLNARDITALMKLGIDVERLNRGEPTELIEERNKIDGRVTVQTDPYEELSVEELRKLARLADASEA